MESTSFIVHSDDLTHKCKSLMAAHKQNTITVYIPTHNRKMLLERAIKSVYSQSLLPDEIIIVDDGSTDDTPTYLEKLSASDSRVKVITNPSPRGACIARNSAISVATGYYITGLDDDDEFLPKHLETLKRNFDPKYSFTANSYLVDNGKKKSNQKSSGIITLDSALHYNKVGNQVFTLTARLKKIGGFDPEMPALQDFDTWIRLIKEFGACKKFKHVTYVQHTSHESPRISSFSEKRLAGLEKFIIKHNEHIEKSHRHSYQIIKKRHLKINLSVLELINLINKNNWKYAITTFLINHR